MSHKKTLHSHVINNKEIERYLQKCSIPAEAKDVELNKSLLHTIEFPNEEENRIKKIITVDSSSVVVPIKEKFPSSLISFFQFGVLLIETSELDNLEQIPFLGPSDMNALKDLKREELVLPIKNVSLVKYESLTNTIRKAIYKFFNHNRGGQYRLLNTLHWFLFETYKDQHEKEIKLSHCPSCKEKNIPFTTSSIGSTTDFQGKCSKCSKIIYLTDFIRLFEAVDDETGAEGIISYTKSSIESFLLIHQIRTVLESENDKLEDYLFVKNGPLSFVGNTATMHTYMRTLLNHMVEEGEIINLVGIENTGAFVEHAKEIENKITKQNVFLFKNEYIYTYILPGNPDESQYATTSYYSGKIIYKSTENKIYILTFPVRSSNYYNTPELGDLKNIEVILMNLEKLNCSISPNTLLPLAVTNKLVSLSGKSRGNIFKRFVKKSTKK